MFRKFHEKLKEREEGFTLIELLVVILIIAILAAIAIPVFLRQREKGYQADAQSSLKNWATAVESAATSTDPPGNYGALTAASIQSGESAKLPSTQTMEYFHGTNGSQFCLRVTETRLDTSNEWRVSIYWSNDGKPTQANACPGTAATAAGSVAGPI